MIQKILAKIITFVISCNVLLLTLHSFNLQLFYIFTYVHFYIDMELFFRLK